MAAPNQAVATPTRRFSIDTLDVAVYPGRESLGRAAAADVVAELQTRLARGGRVRMIVASAPSQAELCAALREAEVDWSRIELYHMDEFIGLAPGASQRFAHWLEENLFGKVPAKHHIITPEPDPEAEATRYAGLLAQAPIDIVCLGIGVNGHIAFNDPPVADFDDPADVRRVTMDAACRQQQVDDGGFSTFDEVPAHALTLTIPRLMRADRLFCVVPGQQKAEAVQHCLKGPITTMWPASILRRHPAATLYLDAMSARHV
ncbi:MAG: glucosamine-6-phosphate deaminase [Pseudomonadota bacterium]